LFIEKRLQGFIVGMEKLHQVFNDHKCITCHMGWSQFKVNMTDASQRMKETEKHFLDFNGLNN